MMRLILLLLTAAFLFHSYQIGSKQWETQVDPSLQGWVEEWCRELEARGLPARERLRTVKSIGIGYSVEGARTAECSVYERTIELNARHLDRNPCAVRSTLYHELGHLAFGLEHGSCNIMRARTLPDEQLYCDWWPELVEEYAAECAKTYQ
jgi:hypothetical protein